MNTNYTDELHPYAEQLDVLFKDLFGIFQASEFLTRDELPVGRGIYAIYEANKPIYVGRSNRIRQRIQEHSRPSSGSESATFAFILAKRKFEEERESMPSSMTRPKLVQDKDFDTIFKQEKIKLLDATFKCIEINNDIVQTMFEPYLAWKLGTYPHNNTFENH